MSTPQPPSADQLTTARLAHWRQNAAEGIDGSAVALLTLESARNFVSSCGLLLFAPRPQHISSPAPSLVEATLGSANSAPTLAQSAEARTLLARLIAEGSAVPLNLLGAPSTTPDAPDFIASVATFPYIFTLRGDKAFKQPPSTGGATKVSPLALNAYTLLLESGPISAYDLVTQLGKEVTEAAVLRSLNELWQHLRVLPVPQPDGGTTLWETVTNRFTKQLKAGANAGQPTALSALISLYLSQALLATETDIETFLSPLAPRSRVRDVLHALTGARQLESIAIDGKTHLHIHGELPIFASQFIDSSGEEEQVEPAVPAVELAEDGTRIKKFIPKPRKVGTGYVQRAKSFGNASRSLREGRSFDRNGPPRDRASRPSGNFAGRSPVDRSSARPARPAFNKPWEEEKTQRAAREGAPAAGDLGEPQFHGIDLEAASAASFPAVSRFDAGSRPAKRPFGAKTSFGRDRPAFPRKSGFGGDRPAFPRKPGIGGGDRPGYGRSREDGPAGRVPRRDFAPREGAETRPPRREFSAGGNPPFGETKPFGKPAFGDRKRDFGDRPGSRASFGEKPRGDQQRRPFRRDESAGEGRPPRRDSNPRATDGTRTPRDNFSKSRPFTPRQDRDAQGGADRPVRPSFRKFDAPRKPFTPREDGESRPPRRDFSSPGKPAFGARKPFVRSESATGSGPREGGYAGKREGSGYPGKKPFGAKPAGFAGKRPFPGKPANRRSPDAPGASTFDKFKGGNKPWGKRPPGRKPRPDQGEA